VEDGGMVTVLLSREEMGSPFFIDTAKEEGLLIRKLFYF
jgi:hypothetical protein